MRRREQTDWPSPERSPGQNTGAVKSGSARDGRLFEPQPKRIAATVEQVPLTDYKHTSKQKKKIFQVRRKWINSWPTLSLSLHTLQQSQKDQGALHPVPVQNLTQRWVGGMVMEGAGEMGKARQVQGQQPGELSVQQSTVYPSENIRRSHTLVPSEGTCHLISEQQTWFSSSWSWTSWWRASVWFVGLNLSRIWHGKGECKG